MRRDRAVRIGSTASLVEGYQRPINRCAFVERCGLKGPSNHLSLSDSLVGSSGLGMPNCALAPQLGHFRGVARTSEVGLRNEGGVVAQLGGAELSIVSTVL